MPAWLFTCMVGYFDFVAAGFQVIFDRNHKHGLQCGVEIWVPCRAQLMHIIVKNVLIIAFVTHLKN